MNYLGANMKLIVECSQKLVHLGEKLWSKEQKLDKDEWLIKEGYFNKEYLEG